MPPLPSRRPAGSLGLELGFSFADDAARSASVALEWLETDGLGGWASGAVSAERTRRYHGLLVAATQPPVARRLLVAKLAETVIPADGGCCELDTNRFPGAIHPQGYRSLASFERDLFPVFLFRGENFRLRKTIASVAGESTAVVVYELVEAARPVALELRPFLAGRDIHALLRESPSAAWRLAGTAASSWRFAKQGEPEVAIGAIGASFEPSPDWWRDFEYAEERARGFDYREDLFTPGTLRVTLAPGQRFAVLVTIGDAERDGLELYEHERARRQRLIAAVAEDPVARRLRLAADQFLVRRGEGWTIIAGYHWFADWGRDAMIALPGLCLATGRLEEARGILRAFAAALDRGMLPNRFPDGGESPEYNTVDATLWLFVAVARYLDAGGDEVFVRDELLSKLDDVLAWHGRGTRYGIVVDGDGLLAQGDPGVQLTWMDARVGDREITPRHGKAVEIEALWYNALRIAADLHRRFERPGRARVLDRLADKVRSRFVELFWNETAQDLVDVVDGGNRDASLRPNQLLAIALPHALLDRPRALAVLKRVEDALLTPVGLRSLAPGSPEYRPCYEGGPAERDAAYHQGTVWSWLLGPYADALARYRGAAGKARARKLVREFLARHLREACVGSVSEIFDAEPPFTPRGAIAQAWSVGELLRVWTALGK